MAYKVLKNFHRNRESHNSKQTKNKVYSDISRETDGPLKIEPDTITIVLLYKEPDPITIVLLNKEPDQIII